MKITILLFCLLPDSLLSQVNTGSVYKELETKKFYSVSLSSSNNGYQKTYKVNGVDVSRATYQKYETSWKNMETCCPCILQSFDENDVLLSEEVACTDCGVGWFRKYYQNGNLKLTGQYKENPTGNWRDIWQRKYCSIATGQWDYYTEDGKKSYSEFWDNGAFLRQVPEQAAIEIWDIDLYLTGEKLDSQTIDINQVKNLSIIPRYKNKNASTSLSVKFEVSAVGYRPSSKQFPFADFKNIDVKSMLEDVKIPKGKETYYRLSVLDGQDHIKGFYLNIKE